MYRLSFILVVESHSNESVRTSICSHAMTKQVRCLMSEGINEIVEALETQALLEVETVR